MLLTIVVRVSCIKLVSEAGLALHNVLFVCIETLRRVHHMVFPRVSIVSSRRQVFAKLVAIFVVSYCSTLYLRLVWRTVPTFVAIIPIVGTLAANLTSLPMNLQSLMRVG